MSEQSTSSEFEIILGDRTEKKSFMITPTPSPISTSYFSVTEDDDKGFPSTCKSSTDDNFLENPSSNHHANFSNPVRRNQESSASENFPDFEETNQNFAQPPNIIEVQVNEADSKLKRNFMIDVETNLFGLLCDDNADGLVSVFRRIAKTLKEDDAAGCSSTQQSSQIAESILGFWFPYRLLHLACDLDSVACAKALIEGQFGMSASASAVDERGRTALHHAAERLSMRCIELLLRRHAKTDLISSDGYSPLRTALHNKRWPKDWQALPAKAIIETLKNQDLNAVRQLARHTKDTLKLACQLALDGDSTALTALLLAVGKELLGKENRYENFIGIIVDKLLTARLNKSSSGFGTSEANSGDVPTAVAARADYTLTEEQKIRSCILNNLEITVLLKDEIGGSQSARQSTQLAESLQGKNAPPILRAAQAGDETIVEILLHDVACANATDSDGNTALHLCLRTSCAAEKLLGIIWLLIRRGSSVNSRNRLGFTPVHIAAGQGQIHALQLLLARDPDTVHIAAETKEIPLFMAVKNNHIECAKLLLQFGSNPQALNLRRQRPIDVATSGDMRTVLSQSTKLTSGMCKGMYTDLLSSTHEGHRKAADHVKLENFQGSYDAALDDDPKILMHRSTHAYKTVLCRYHKSGGGCARGDACFYAHGEHELRSSSHEKTKIQDIINYSKKIFVGGLPPTMRSDELRECFQSEFGPVIDAAVMGNILAGSKIQSRGFGFVTFKNQSSYLEAVRKHFIMVAGKKVEIKAAMQFPSKTDEELLETHLSVVTKDAFYEQQLPEEPVKWKTNPLAANDTTKKQKGSSTQWLPVFKMWFPAFLNGVLQRQGGTCYPLSSVKADFRATCSMELDHASLGYAKLSDFLHTMPDICQMKIVPVGKGPATHVILMPSQQNLSAKTCTSRISNSSLVHEGRTYAAAAGNTAAISSDTEITKRSIEINGLKSPKAEKFKEKLLIRRYASTENSETADFALRICDNMTANGFDVNQNTCNVSGITTNAELRKQIYENQLQSAIQDIEKYNPFPNVNDNGERIRIPPASQKICTGGMERTVHHWTSNNTSPEKNVASHQVQKVCLGKSTSESSQSGYTIEGNSVLPHDQLSTIPETANSKHEAESTILPPFASLRGKCSSQELNVKYQPIQSFLLDHISPSYNPWNSNAFQGCGRLIQQMNSAANRSRDDSEESSKSNLTSEDSLESPTQSVRKPEPIWRCAICGHETAIWTALPCAHRVMCSYCKDYLQRRNQSFRQCFICSRGAQDWILQY